MTVTTPYAISILFLFIFGTCIGSFLNSVIYRMPLKISLIKPRSYCPSCNNTIPIFGLIPIFGYFILLQKCYYCKSKISIKYPILELFTGLSTAILYIHFIHETKFLTLFLSSSIHDIAIIQFVTSLWLLYSGICLFFIDLKYHILPDLITIPGTFVCFLLSAFNPQIGISNSLLGFAVGFGGLYLISKIYELLRKKQGMGFGDVKYLGFIGAAVGPLGVFLTLFFACVIGSVFGIIYGLITKKGLSIYIPFGPFLAISTLSVYIYLCLIN